MTADDAVVRSPIKSLIGESLHRQDGRSHLQASACGRLMQAGKTPAEAAKSLNSIVMASVLA